MAFYRTINMTFWTDSKIAEDFTPEDKLFYLYLMTNPHTHVCGCYELGVKQMADETGFSKDQVAGLIVKLTETHNVIRYSLETKEILLLNWSKYNWSASETVRAAVSKGIEAVKCSVFKTFLQSLLDGTDTVHIGYEVCHDTVSIGYQYPMDITYTFTVTNTVTNTVSNTDTVKKGKDNRGVGEEEKPKKPRAKFEKPTVEEIREYCEERNNNVDPQRFLDFYESKGWLVGKTKMVDWKAAVRNWEKNDRASPRSGTSGSVDMDKYWEEL